MINKLRIVLALILGFNIAVSLFAENELVIKICNVLDYIIPGTLLFLLLSDERKETKKHKAYCEFCNTQTAYHIIEKDKTATVDGSKYDYSGREAICDKCGKEIYVGEVSDYNLRHLHMKINKGKHS